VSDLLMVQSRQLAEYLSEITTLRARAEKAERERDGFHKGADHYYGRAITAERERDAALAQVAVMATTVEVMISALRWKDQNPRDEVIGAAKVMLSTLDQRAGAMAKLIQAATQHRKYVRHSVPCGVCEAIDALLTKTQDRG
jgi:hypothetical protein